MTGSLDQLRIVLVGKTGNGKSSTGNSLLHSRTAFQSIQSSASVTKNCQAQIGRWENNCGKIKEILVVDTPGFFDTDINNDNAKVEKTIASQIFTMTSPGVHAFLIVVNIGRFSPEEQQTVDFIKTIFGADAAKYCIVVFTREDQLEDGQSLESFVSASKDLQALVNICGNRKIAINNRMSGQLLVNKTQQLWDIIEQMVNENNGTYYTNAEYEIIEQQRREEERRIQEAEAARQRAEDEERLRILNLVKSVRTETRSIQTGSTPGQPIYATERKRKGGLGGLISHRGSGYNYYQVKVGIHPTTLHWREEQREIKTLNSGREEFGEWIMTKQWSTT